MTTPDYRLKPAQRAAATLVAAHAAALPAADVGPVDRHVAYALRVRDAAEAALAEEWTRQGYDIATDDDRAEPAIDWSDVDDLDPAARPAQAEYRNAVAMLQFELARHDADYALVGLDLETLRMVAHAYAVQAEMAAAFSGMLLPLRPRLWCARCCARTVDQDVCTRCGSQWPGQ